MDLFSDYRLGTLTLKNRIVMSAMTRSRAVDGNVPSPLAATYYGQRASAGLIVTEATQVSPQGNWTEDDGGAARARCRGESRDPSVFTKGHPPGGSRLSESHHNSPR